ncbi:MAG: glutamate--tRNA ligase, partial [Chitinophagales bacterium]|nr:glutamate--tRNA ligase [Chitinophagales bacterium]
FIALLGWHPTGDKELFSMEEMIDQFSIEHIHKAGAKFDFEKAKWFNHEYMKKKSGSELASYFIPILNEKNILANENYVAKVCDVLKGRCNFISEFWANSSFFFEEVKTFDESIVKSKWNEKAKQNFIFLEEELKNQNDFSVTAIDQLLHSFLQKNNLKPGELLPVLRVALIGTKNGPSVFEIISLLGKEKSLSRLQNVHAIFDQMILIK